MNYVQGANTVKKMIDIFSQKQKERTDIILEPLQAMIQLGLLTYSPPGTKLAIQHNVLILQPPNITQGLFRWYAGDRKDDLFFLFHVFRRFIVWYSNDGDKRLYNTLLHHAFLGINSLMKTYKSSEMSSLVHVLQMYKTFLQRPYYFLEESNFIKTKKKRSLSLGDDTNEIEESRRAESVESEREMSTTSTPFTSPARSPILGSPPPEAKSLDVDMIFIQTKQFYSQSLKTILIEAFNQLEQSETQDYQYIISGINSILKVVTKQIEPWIKQKLVF